MAKAPQGFLGYTALLGDPVPSKWDRVKQALWDTNLNAPIRGVYNLMNADPYTLYTDEGAAGQQAAVDSFDAGGGITVGSAMVPKPSNAMAMGIKAYHGSPHSFDKFSMDKIGTGEGAQAYGHGLYFAENEGVAKGYRDTLSGSMVSGAQKRLKKAGGDVDMAIADVQSRIDNYRANGAPQYADAIEEDLRGLLKFKETGEWTPGSMYEVNIDADPNAFLDWDKPLSEQPPQVQDALAAMDSDMYHSSGADYDPTELGQSIYQRLNNQRMPDVPTGGVNGWMYVQRGNEGQPRATADLNSAGIPGIKYLDAGSRVPSRLAQKELDGWKEQLDYAQSELAKAKANGERHRTSYYEAEVKRAQDGFSRTQKEAEGTRNYVVFDDKLISIVKKYGIAGASAMLGYNVMTGANNAQASELGRADKSFRKGKSGGGGW